MDMSDEDNAPTTTVPISELTPVPHEDHHHHGLPILESKLSPAERLYWESYNTTTYLTMETPYHHYLTFHIATIFLIILVFYPTALILNNLESRWYLPILTVNNTVLTLSLVSYLLFIGNVENLYPGNVYGKMGIILFFFMIVHYISALIKNVSIFMKNSGFSSNNFHPKSASYIPMNEYHNDGLDSPASTLLDQNRGGNSTDFELESGSLMNENDHIEIKSRNFLTVLRDGLLEKIYTNRVLSTIAQALDRVAELVFALTNHIILVYLFVYVCTGVAVWNLLGKDNHFFNLLAHFIKGGVFFCLGVLSLCRYLGAFEKAGLGWNYSYVGKFEQLSSRYLRFLPSTSMLTMEMIESSLILFYGSTNVFMEHLAAPGGAWTAKDLQHVSIAFMYIGCGLCGVMTEIKLSKWRREKFMSQLAKLEPATGISKIEVEAIRTCTPGFSPNPFPAFTIFFTGLLMSLHLQASELSTQIHVQWGSLLTYGSVVRLFTMVLMLFWKYDNYESLFKPVRPFTELITSFALLCGGLVFMESTDPVIEAMEYRGFTGMFTLNLSVGFITILMGWIMILLAFRDRVRSQY